MTMMSSVRYSSSLLWRRSMFLQSKITHQQRLFVGAAGATRASSTIIPNDFLQIDPTVQEALANRKPVVALESTIVAHGMPFPENLQLVQRIESILRSKGVIPATIAIKNGTCRVGLSMEELEDLAKAGEEGRAKKCSTRDIPILLATQKGGEGSGGGHHRHLWGATTVASTMKLAHAAGISTFVTGGIGGVHRDGHVSMDVSADLTELSRTPVVVISAGIKSILDIGRTLQVLETNSVPTIGWKTDEFPAFFSSHSGVPSPSRMDHADQVASAYWAGRALDLPQGMVVAVPNDDPAGANVEQAIQDALAEADAFDIQGQAVTPFILKNVAERTKGDSLRSNMALVEENAKVGAEIAIAIASRHQSLSPTTLDTESKAMTESQKLTATTTAPSTPISTTTTTPAATVQHPLHFSKNLALVKGTGELCISSFSPSRPDSSPAHPDRGGILKSASMLLLHGSVPFHILASAAKQASGMNSTSATELMFNPSGESSAIEACKEAQFLSSVTYIFANVAEVLALSDGWTDSFEELELALAEKNLNTIKQGATKTLEKMKLSEESSSSSSKSSILITLGCRGLLLATRSGKYSETQFHHFENQNVGLQINKGTASGDCVGGAFIHSLLDDNDEATSAAIANQAVESLLCEGRLIYPLMSQLECLR